MSERKINFSVGEFYHLFNRGTDKREIFLDARDYDRFMFLLYLCNSKKPVNIREQFPKGISFGLLKNFERGETLVDIGIYCLMPNHFHLLVMEKEEGGITNFIKKLATAYSMYFNKRNKRSGKLFENYFKAEHVDKDEYLKYLFAYIHLNPIKIKSPLWRENGVSSLEEAGRFLEKYDYSSYSDYIGKERNEKIILKKDSFPVYFMDQSFKSFIDDWLKFPKEFPLGMGIGGGNEL